MNEHPLWTQQAKTLLDESAQGPRRGNAVAPEPRASGGFGTGQAPFGCVVLPAGMAALARCCWLSPYGTARAAPGWRHAGGSADRWRRW